MLSIFIYSWWSVISYICLSAYWCAQHVHNNYRLSWSSDKQFDPALNKPNNYWLYYHDILYRRSWSPEDNDFDNPLTFPLVPSSVQNFNLSFFILFTVNTSASYHILCYNSSLHVCFYCVGEFHCWVYMWGFPDPACLPPEGTDMLIESLLAVLHSEVGVSVFVPMTSLFSVVGVQLFQRVVHIWTTCCITAGNFVLLQNYI